jgi:hypothetical protein
LNDGTKISGEISSGGALLCYISSGYIDEELIYRYYYKVENGGYKLGWVKAKWVTIFEDATVENARYVYRHCAKRKVYKNGNMGYGVEYYDCEFHVPPNSIIRKFDLDAE